jgi:chromosome segregation ATPase
MEQTNKNKMEYLNDTVISLNTTLGFVQQKLDRIEAKVDTLATQGQITELKRKDDELEIQIEKIKTQYWELAIKVALATGALTIVVELVLNKIAT